MSELTAYKPFNLEDFDTGVNHVRDQLLYLMDLNQRLTQELHEYDKDAKIAELKKKIRALQDCTFQINEVEQARAEEFIKKHNHNNVMTTFTYSFTTTGIGTTIFIKCNNCGEEENITDYDCW